MLRRLFGRRGRNSSAGKARDPLAEARDAVARADEEADLAAQNLDLARNPEAAFDEAEAEGIILKRGEQVIGVLGNSGLVEVKAGRVEYRGGSQGVSIRIAKGVTYRTGAHKGTAYREPEKPRLLCSGGSFWITDKRAVYVGPKHTREWAWPKLVSMHTGAGEGGRCLLMATDNRVRTSGVLVGNDKDWVLGRCELGVAIAQDTLEDLVSQLEQEAVAANKAAIQAASRLKELELASTSESL